MQTTFIVSVMALAVATTGCALEHDDLFGPAEGDISLNPPSIDGVATPASPPEAQAEQDERAASLPPQEGTIACMQFDSMQSCEATGAPHELLRLDPLVGGEYTVDDGSVTLVVLDDSFDYYASTPIDGMIIESEVGVMACFVSGPNSYSLSDVHAPVDPSTNERAEILSVTFCGK